MANKKKIIIFGLGGGARDVLGIIDDINRINPIWEVVGFVGKKNERKNEFIEGYNIIQFDDLPKSNKYYAIPSVTNPSLKRNIVTKQIAPNGYRLPILIHPNTYISSDFIPEPGLIIFPAVRISYNVKIGELVWLDSNCNIGHNVKIGDYTSILPMSLVLGTVGNNCLIGARSVLHQRIKIGNNSLVGVGTTVIKDIPKNTKVINFPRNVISKIK